MAFQNAQVSLPVASNWIGSDGELPSMSIDTDFQIGSDGGETGNEPRVFLRRGEGSSTLEELQSHPVFGAIWSRPTQFREEPSALENARDHRLALLAKRFEGSVLSREEDARIAILTQRLRRLAPRVSHISWTIAEESVNQLENVASRIEEIGAKYGL